MIDFTPQRHWKTAWRRSILEFFPGDYPQIMEIEKAPPKMVNLVCKNKNRHQKRSQHDYSTVRYFCQVADLQQEFVFRVCHLERIVEIYNERLDRWETEKLQDLVACLITSRFQLTFLLQFATLITGRILCQ